MSVCGCACVAFLFYPYFYLYSFSCPFFFDRKTSRTALQFLRRFLQPLSCFAFALFCLRFSTCGCACARARVCVWLRAEAALVLPVPRGLREVPGDDPALVPQNVMKSAGGRAWINAATVVGRCVIAGTGGCLVQVWGLQTLSDDAEADDTKAKMRHGYFRCPACVTGSVACDACEIRTSEYYSQGCPPEVRESILSMRGRLREKAAMKLVANLAQQYDSLKEAGEMFDHSVLTMQVTWPCGMWRVACVSVPSRRPPLPPAGVRPCPGLHAKPEVNPSLFHRTSLQHSRSLPSQLPPPLWDLQPTGTEPFRQPPPAACQTASDTLSSAAFPSNASLVGSVVLIWAGLGGGRCVWEWLTIGWRDHRSPPPPLCTWTSHSPIYASPSSNASFRSEVAPCSLQRGHHVWCSMVCATIMSCCTPPYGAFSAREKGAALCHHRISHQKCDVLSVDGLCNGRKQDLR